MNDCGYRETFRDESTLVFERTGFPLNKEFKVSIDESLSDDAILHETRKVYNQQTLWLHAVNGIPWLAAYFLVFFSIKRKLTKANSSEQ